MSTNYFFNNSLFNFKTGDRPSQEDFKKLILGLQNNYIPGELKFVNKDFPQNNLNWEKIEFSLFPTLSGEYDSSVNGTFTPLVSTPHLSGWGLYEIIGTLKDGSRTRLSEYLNSRTTNRQKHSYLTSIISNKTILNGITGIPSTSYLTSDYARVLSTINLRYAVNKAPYSYRITSFQSILVDREENVFNLLYNDNKNDKVYPDFYNKSYFQYLPKYVSYSPITFDFATLFRNIGEYDSFIRIKTLLNSLTSNVIPVNTGFYKNDLFYLSHLSGFENLVNYIPDTNNFTFIPNTDDTFNNVLANNFRNFGNNFSSPLKLSGVLVDPAFPTSVIFDLNLYNLPLTANFNPGEYFIVNYYPQLSSNINNLKIPRSQFLEVGNPWSRGGTTIAYECINFKNNGQKFYPITLFNVLCALGNYGFSIDNKNNIGAGIIIDLYQVKTNLDSYNNQQDLYNSKIVKTAFAKLTGTYNAYAKELSGLYVDLAALTGFMNEPLHLSSFNGDVDIWKLDPEFQDNIITIFDIPSSFYSHSPILTSLYPAYIPADTTIWSDIDSRVHALTSLVVPAHVLNLSSFFNIESEKFRYYFEMDVPKYNFVGAPFYDKMPVWGINHPLTGTGQTYTNEYYYQYTLTIIPTSWNMGSYWYSVSTLPVSGSQFINISAGVVELTNSPYSFLSSNYTISYSNGLSSAKRLFNTVVEYDFLEKTFIKKDSNNKVTPFSFAVYACITNPGNGPDYSLVYTTTAIPLQDNFYNNLPTILMLNTSPLGYTGDVYLVNYTWIQDGWNNKIPPALSSYYTSYTYDQVNHVKLKKSLRNAPGTLFIPTVDTSLVLSKGSVPYLYSALLNNTNIYKENLTYDDTFIIPFSGSLYNFLKVNNLDLYIYTGLSGQRFNSSLSAANVTIGNTGGSFKIDNNKIVFTFIDPNNIFNLDQSVDYSLSSVSIGLSSFSHISNNISLGYLDNFFLPLSVFKNNNITFECNKLLHYPEIGRDKNSYIEDEDIFLADTKYMYVSTARAQDFYYFYGDSFPSLNILSKKIFNYNSYFITDSGSYITALAYDNSNDFVFYDISNVYGTLSIMHSRRKSRTLIGTNSKVFSIPQATSLPLPTYPE
jgi:hypothetical protein